MIHLANKSSSSSSSSSSSTLQLLTFCILFCFSVFSVSQTFWLIFFLFSALCCEYSKIWVNTRPSWHDNNNPWRWLTAGSRQSVHVSVRLPRFTGSRLHAAASTHVGRLPALCRSDTDAHRSLATTATHVQPKTTHLDTSLTRPPCLTSSRRQLLACTGYGCRNDDNSAPCRRILPLQRSQVGGHPLPWQLTVVEDRWSPLTIADSIGVASYGALGHVPPSTCS